MRARRAAESGDPTSVLADDHAPVVDLTVPWAAAKPPDYSGVAQIAQQQHAESEVVDYSRGGFSKPGLYQPQKNALAKVPGAKRHDLVKAQMTARAIAAAENEPELASWDDMNTPSAEQAWMVNFGRPASFYERPALTPSPYAQAILGQAVAVARPRPQRPNLAAPQKTPAIIN
jgi:hypothetical protein